MKQQYQLLIDNPLAAAGAAVVHSLSIVAHVGVGCLVLVLLCDT